MEPIMSSFLFIPTPVAGATRRVDFGNIATLFAEAEEPVRRGETGRKLLRLAAAVLLAALALGDTLLVTRAASTVCDGPAPAASSPVT